ncbi:hypothetical protein FIU28_16685 [Tardiphaga sp. vice154]|uniref:hypothetical protein n=1 Tax=Tardiphaga sp. vice154 TaxID=2592814 RepID=UPI001164729D|nr:hypothetical protein [Tardiphaga sp. vice154]QDM22608.1 hypothetical protein FIU28_16685 [Tardiphaga sp. vice154]
MSPQPPDVPPEHIVWHSALAELAKSDHRRTASTGSAKKDSEKVSPSFDGGLRAIQRRAYFDQRMSRYGKFPQKRVAISRPRSFSQNSPA